MSRPPFKLMLPAAIESPVVVASPHSGRIYDADFMASTVLDSARIRSSEDAYVDVLLDRVPNLGVPVLSAQMPRAFLDLNRAPEELDPAVIDDVPRGAMNPRVSSGLGVIPRVVAQGRAIYSGKISHAEAQHRIDTFWRPYHRQLDVLMSNARDQFGQAILLDFHSMPHEAIEGTVVSGAPAQIVLGDRFGSSANPVLVDILEETLTDLGFRVARNAPFAGAYVTQAYGHPERGWHAIQIEIDRSLYLDEGSIRPNTQFDVLQNTITEAVSRFCDCARPTRNLAAE
ncbi:N-formylglutamate amidohydrolase [Jannaschia helgolandensis]|uniref:N-formylglutamate deformylase n=1 Tax=Jannaschia helgolandensis TaxID=188906 RepID=A0A1H7I1U6_9RHOB|nr:N-formylglutamate amidohydrolase [Jannaschia helgolandensis]SEK54485.1 N-formylglutamate deformylase [Jannaschia helgolandensis]